jgi:hypothetical protein
MAPETVARRVVVDAGAAALAAPATISFRVSPAGVAGLSITVDGRAVDGLAFTTPRQPGRRLRVVVSAPGYEPVVRRVLADDVTVDVQLRRRTLPGAPGGAIGL